MKPAVLNRFIHRWGSIIVAIPIGIILVTGIILQLKKYVEWIQPSTRTGSAQQLHITFDQILETAKSIPQAKISSWSDIDRLDVRPNKGILKVRSKNRWEIQIDTKNADVVLVAYRRSDLIESIHDGSFFHNIVKLLIFLPAGLLLLTLWFTGVYLFFLPHLNRRKRRRQAKAITNRDSR